MLSLKKLRNVRRNDGGKFIKTHFKLILGNSDNISVKVHPWTYIFPKNSKPMLPIVDQQFGSIPSKFENWWNLKLTKQDTTAFFLKKLDHFHEKLETLAWTRHRWLLFGEILKLDKWNIYLTSEIINICLNSSYHITNQKLCFIQFMQQIHKIYIATILWFSI